MNILLDYFFPITSITPTPAASTAFLKQLCVMVKPKVGVTIVVPTLCTSAAEVAALTDNTEAAEALSAGMSKVYVWPSADLNLATALETHGSLFYTIAVSSDFDDAEYLAADFGAWDGVVGFSSTDQAFLATNGAAPKRSPFFTEATNKAKNMVYAFGKLLSNQLAWKNQQYITVPYDGGVTTLGKAESIFDDRVSFAMTDTQFGKRLGLFVAGGQAIAAPYIERELEIDLQSEALSYIAENQPDYTNTQAALLEDELQKVIDEFISRAWIDAGVVEIKLEQDNFVASGYINISEPKALWRVLGEVKQTL